MMNSPLDNNQPPDFYAGKPSSGLNVIFKNGKKPITSYLGDGRKVVNGEIEVRKI